MRQMSREELAAFASRLTKELADQGRIVEGGWAGFKVLIYPEDVPQEQLDELRTAFFAGAQHLFASLLMVITDDDKVEEIDLRRMDRVHKELQEFLAVFKKKHGLKLGMGLSK